MLTRDLFAVANRLVDYNAVKSASHLRIALFKFNHVRQMAPRLTFVAISSANRKQ